MSSKTEEVQQKIIKIVQELLLEEEDRSTITTALIAGKIDLVVQLNPKWGVGLDREAVTDELIRRYSLWIGQDTALKSDVGHVQWLISSRRKDWRYWSRYREWLERKLSPAAVEGLDRSTDTVLGLLEDPSREGSWDRRGLVVGHIQSGKTGHYTGLISKAADAGYKIIIVLAGLHNNLRSQTQMRLDEGFLGYETKPVPEGMQIIGVGEIDGDPSIRPNYATNRSNNGDFSTAVARSMGITPEQRPWLFVVKKNKTILERIRQWVENRVATTQDSATGRKIVTTLPLLLIDDEADHASVDTGEIVFNEDGTPDAEHEPTTINRLIRQILHSFARSAYVGYTATPFANIFIHERAATRDEGPDLFPSAFIINLAAPSDYVGPAKVFGSPDDTDRIDGMPLVRTIDDHMTEDGLGGWMPQRHKNGHIPLYGGADSFPPSLDDAIHAFLLSCAVRKLRGQGTQHSSMLVHVTRFNSVQQHVQRQIEERVRHLRQRLARGIGHEQILLHLRTLWENDFLPTSVKMKDWQPELKKFGLPSWEDIEEVLPDVISDIQVKMINGTAKDALDYSEHDAVGLKVIAIGGDKLARGLTLEGLSVSYFLRASRMYDTLMQMGRWFGYRPGYLDLCRLYTTSELSEWFRHIADAADELREEFDLMAASGATPREYGLKVQSHPVLMVTSRLKMRSAQNLMLSFSGQVLETIALFRDHRVLNANLEVAKHLISTLGVPEVDPSRDRGSMSQSWSGFLWRDIPFDRTVAFLQSYKTHPEAHKVNGLLLAEFITSMTKRGELTHWTVALIGGGEGKRFDFGNNITVDMLKRSSNADHVDRYSIGRLLSPRDESIDLDKAEWSAALSVTRAAWHADPAKLHDTKEPPDSPSGHAIRRIRGFGVPPEIPAHPERGVLFLYVLDPQKASAGFAEDAPPIVAFGISFPSSDAGVKVEYKVNNVLWEQEYGSAE